MPGNRAGEPPDPSPVSTFADLATALRTLQSWAGRPSLRRLRQLGGTRPATDGAGTLDALPESTVSYVLRGARPAGAEFVRCFVAACLRARQRDPAEIAVQVERWHEAWLVAAGHTAAGHTAAGESVAEHAAAGPAGGRGVAEPGTPPPYCPVPRQLPADVAGFTGRAAELTALRRLLPPEGGPGAPLPGLAVIAGTAGVGKTALAVRAAHWLAPAYPDGQLFIDLHGFTAAVSPVDPADALDRVLRVLGVPSEQIPPDLDDRAGLWRSLLAGRRMLVLLDNVATEGQVRPLLPGNGGNLVMVTSRRRLAGLEATLPLSLDVLAVADAALLFTRTADPASATTIDGTDGRPGTDGWHGADGPDELVAEAVELCGRLPLAIRVAAARLRSRPAWSLSDLVARLRDQDRRLGELVDDDGPRSVASALALSYQQLAPDQQLLYERLGQHPGPEFDQYAAAALLDTGPEAAAHLLDRLLDAHLVQESTPGRYGFHDLVRAHAAGTVPARRRYARRRRQRAIGRLLDYYRHAAAVAMDAAYPYERDRRPAVPPACTASPALSDPDRAIEWLDLELPNLVAVARYAAGAGWPDHTWQIPAILHRHLRTRGRYHDAGVLHRQALSTTRATGQSTGALGALTGLAEVDRLTGRFPAAQAEFDDALALARRIGARGGELVALLGLGRVHLMQDRYRQAIDHFEQSLEIARDTGNRPGELDALVGLGDATAPQGRYQDATGHFKQALQIARDTGNRPGELNTLRGIGLVHRALGRYPQAIHHFEQSLQISRATGNRPGELNALTGLGEVYRLQGRHEPALACFRQTLQLARATGHRNGELNALTGLAEIQRQQGRYEPAAGYYQQVLELARELGDRNWEFEVLHGLGRLHHAAGRPEQAVAHHERALELATRLGQPADQARAHDGLGNAHHALCESARARDHWRQALHILVTLGTDYTEDPEANVPTIRGRLAALEPA